MKDPSIHIRRSDLIEIFKSLRLDLDIYDLANTLLVQARQYSIQNRVQVTTKAKAKKKSDRSVESDTKLLDQFNRIYMGVMLSNNIKTMSIGKTSPQYPTLKEVCGQAKEFSDLLGMAYEQGFKLYVETGVHLLGNKFGIYRLKGYALKILEYHQAKTLINNDPNPDGTDDIITAWSQAVRVYYKTSIELEDDAQRAHFIHAREMADSLKADYYDYICSHFEKWAYLNSIPSFSQLYGDQSKLIYQTYMAKVKKENPSKEETTYFNKVKTNEKTIQTKTAVEGARIRKARIHSSLESSGSKGIG